MSYPYYPQPNGGPPPLPPRGPPPPIPHHSRPVPPVPQRAGAAQDTQRSGYVPPCPAPSYPVTQPFPVSPPPPSYELSPNSHHAPSPNAWPISLNQPIPPTSSSPNVATPPLPLRKTISPPSVLQGNDQVQHGLGVQTTRVTNNPGSPFNPNHTLPKFCPKFDQYLFPGAKWYGVIPTSTSYTICSKCYHENVANSQFSFHFSVLPDNPTPTVYLCDFSISRSKRLWAQALSTGDINPFKQFAQERSTAIMCAGKQGVKGSAPNAPPKWYAPSSAHRIDNFIVCATCYEEEIRGTPLEVQFAEYRTIKGHGAEDVWTCGLAQTFHRAAIKDAANGECTWEAAAQCIAMRQQIPTCPGRAQVKPSPYAWWRPKKEIRGMVICSACYLDWVLCRTTTTPGFGSNDFERVPDSLVIEAEKSSSMWSCDLAVLGILLPTCQEFSIPEPSQHTAYEELWRAAVESQIASSCANQPQDQIAPNVKSYALKSSSGPINSRPIPFDICEPCYNSYIRVLGLERFFVETNYRTLGTALSCDLSQSSPKLGNLVTKLIEAFAMDNFSIFETFVKERLQLPGCPRESSEPNRNWYGIGSDFLVCPECYLDVVKPSALNHLIDVQNICEPSPTHCMLYSPRTRELWNQACSSGSVTSLLEFQRKRSAVYLQVVPRLLELRNTWQARKNQQQEYLNLYAGMSQAARNSNTLATLSNIHAMNYGSYGYRYGPSPTSHAAQLSAATSSRQADQWMAKAMSIVISTDQEIAEEKRLCTLWAEVE